MQLIWPSWTSATRKGSDLFLGEAWATRRRDATTPCGMNSLTERN